jgi:teichuronic acid biosynthesis glycosyltransferase TuaC
VAAAIKDILANPPKREAVAANVSGFSWEENAQALAAFFRSVAGAPS